MRGGAPPIEQPRLGKNESAGAYSGNPPVALGSFAHEFDQAGGKWRDDCCTANHKGIERLVREDLGLEHQPRRSPDQAPLFGHVAQIVRLRIDHGIGHFEARHDGKRHQGVAGINKKSDVAQGIHSGVLNLRIYDISVSGPRLYSCFIGSITAR